MRQPKSRTLRAATARRVILKERGFLSFFEAETTLIFAIVAAFLISRIISNSRFRFCSGFLHSFAAAAFQLFGYFITLLRRFAVRLSLFGLRVTYFHFFLFRHMSFLALCRFRQDIAITTVTSTAIPLRRSIFRLALRYAFGIFSADLILRPLSLLLSLCCRYAASWPVYLAIDSSGLADAMMKASFSSSIVDARLFHWLYATPVSPR
jgi:hypothetical protein